MARSTLATLLVFGAAALAGCGDEGEPVDPVPPDPLVVEHLRACEERCDEELRCSMEALPREDCLALCEAMADDAGCRALHADYYECQSLVSCAGFDAQITAVCGDALQGLARDCAPWRDAAR